MTEQQLIDAVRREPANEQAYAVYADWLEERGDPRAELVRLQRAMQTLSPDHVRWHECEVRLSQLRIGCDDRWLDVFEPDRPRRRKDWECSCYEPGQRILHREKQDTESPGWRRLVELIDQAADDGRTTFAPSRELSEEDCADIITLPPAVTKLTKVRDLVLYGSYLTRLPPEIGDMSSLRVFTPYTSYSLHWFPYEITRCSRLRDSTVSTRATFGNSKTNMPFATLTPTGRTSLWPSHPTRPCCICGTEYEDWGRHRGWVRRVVATDTLPLLVNACSSQCLQLARSSATS